MTKKIKLGIPIHKGAVQWGHIEKKMMMEEFDVVHNLDKADIIFFWNTVVDTSVDLKKCFVFAQESPLTSHRRWIYANPELFHTAVFHDPEGENQLRFSDNPSVFPWVPTEGRDLHREDTTITDRIVFYAGARKSDNYKKVIDNFDTIILCTPRNKMVSLLSKYPNVRIYGLGWEPKINAICGKSTRLFDKKLIKPDEGGNWRIAKIEDVNDCNADFHLCIENCYQRNLVTDHFHDGFTSDRVVLYLGCKNIEDYVPTDCFVDLRPYFDTKKKELDVKKVMEIVDNMTQEEYDKILNNARAWRKSIVGKYKEESIKFTKRLIERIKCKH